MDGWTYMFGTQNKVLEIAHKCASHELISGNHL